MSGIDLGGFVAVAIVVVITPGPDMALVARNTLAGGRAIGFATSLGTCSGLLVHAVAAAFGLSAILLASSRVFTAVKVAGAVYLVLLGLRTLRSAGRPEEPPGRAASESSAWAAYRQGALTNLLNPKVAVFFLSLLPQFVAAGDGFVWRVLTLATVFIAMGVAWLFAYTVALSAFGHVVARRRIRRAIETATGAVLVFLGLRLAVAER